MNEGGPAGRPTAVRVAAFLLTAATGAGLLLGLPGSAASAPLASERAGAAEQQRAPRPARVRVKLGLHNYQPLTEPGRHLRLRDARLTLRSACWLEMGTTMPDLRGYVRTMEGLPAVFAGCSSDPASRKYSSGPMSGAAGLAYTDVLGTGTAAVPSVAAYTRWLTKLRQVLGRKLYRWEVWNEVDLGPFYRGTPSDLVDLTYAAARVLGRKRVIAPSFSTGPYYHPNDPSGMWENGRRLTKAQTFTRYWTLLVRRARAKGKPLPVSAANIHAYGKGANIKRARLARLDVLRTFRNSLLPVLRRYDLPIWDTEGNFRRTGRPDPRQGIGFDDRRQNVAAWKLSLREASCLGYERQFLYTWTQGRTSDDFTRSTLQLNPHTPRMLRAYRTMHQRKIKCDLPYVHGRSQRPLPSVPAR